MMVQFKVLGGRLQQLMGAARRLVLAVPLALSAALPAQAFDGNFNRYSTYIPLAGFSGLLSDNCVLSVENLRVGAGALGTAGTTGTSFIDFRRNGGVFGLPLAVAATPRELDNNTVVTSFETAITAAWIEGKCGLTDVTNLVQTSPNGTNYANSSYHGITFRGRQSGVQYQWEVAFSGLTNTQLINTRTAVPAPPTVTQVNPTSGPTAGNNSVVITGTNFTAASTVTFGANPATNVTFNSATQLTVTAPAGTGTVAVRVSTLGGTSADTNADDYTYSTAAPVLALTATPSATEQTQGRPFTFTVTPSATVATAGPAQLRLEATFPDFWDASGESNADWTCRARDNGSSLTVFCTSVTPIAAGSNGTPVTITVLPSTDGVGYVQSFTLSGGGAASSATVAAPSVDINGLLQTQVQAASTTLTQGVAATPFTPVTRISGGTAGFSWAVNPILPVGLSLRTSTGEITGIPTNTLASTSYTFTVTDARGATSSRTVNITVNPPAPVVTGLSVSSGPQSGDTSVVITGENFTGVTAVSFGNTAAKSFTYNSPTQITATTNAGSGAVPVRVTTAAATSAITANGNFTFLAPPTVSVAFLQTTLRANGTDTAVYRITLSNPNTVALGSISIFQPIPSGLNLVSQFNTCGGSVSAGSTDVTVANVSMAGSASCSLDLSFNSSIAGSYNVTVSTVSSGGGNATVPAAATLTVNPPAPTITSVSPSRGPVAGGTSVTITGTNLNGATQVNFGATVIPAASLTPVSANSITFNSPSGTAGTVDITVSTPSGTSANTASDDFTYVLPPTATVEFLDTSIPADGNSVARYRVTVTNPNAVALTNVTFSQSFPSGLTLMNLSISGCGGFSASAGGGSLGYTFASGTLAANASCSVTANLNSTTAGSYDITLTSLTSSGGDGTLPTTAAPLTVAQLAPVVTSVSPTSGPAGPVVGGTLVTISGSNFTGVTQVNFGGVVYQPTDLLTRTANTITLLAPNITSGTVDITVTTPGGTSANTANDDFTFVMPPTATVEFTPASIIGNGTDQTTYRITVTNPNAQPLTRVSFIQTIPTGLTRTSLSQVGCGGDESLSNASGFAYSERTLGANQSCVVTATFVSATPNTYNLTLGSLVSRALTGVLLEGSTPTAATLTVRSATPSISSVSPGLGLLAGGTSVTISGSNFTGATEVNFGGTVIPAADFTAASDSAITVRSPVAAAAGAVDITVTTPTGSDIRAAAFTYGVVPVLTAFTHSPAIPYNPGGAVATSIDAAAASSPTGSPTSYAIAAASANGATVNVTNAGVVSYTPAAGFRGPDTFGLTATNAFGTSAQITVTVLVANPAFIAGGVGTSATVGAPFFANVSISGGTGPYSAFSATALPPGLTISSAGVISGSPIMAGTFNAVVVTATDSSTPPMTASATNALTITVAQGTQTITFADPGVQTFGTTPTVSATSSSGLTVTFSSLTTAVCSVTREGQLSFAGAGSCQIAADQAGDSNFAAAAQVTRTFTVNAVNQQIVFTNPGAQTLGTSKNVVADASSRLPVVFSSLTPQVCTVTEGGVLTLLSEGNCQIAANQPGNSGINPAPQVTQSFAVNKANQLITFANPGAQLLGTSPTLVATADSGLAVAFSSLSPAICTVTPSGALTPVAIGTCEVQADQVGNGIFGPATPVTQRFAIGQMNQTITFLDPVPQPGKAAFVAGDQVTLSAKASSGLPVAFTGLTPETCAVSSAGALRFVKPGPCTVAADQPGNLSVSAAARVTKTIQVGGVDPVVEVNLVTKMQVARARALVLNQPELSPLLGDAPSDSTALSVSSKGGNIDLVRVGGPVWLRLSGSVTEQSGGTRDHYAQFSFGTHMYLGPQTILGLMGTVDTMSLTDPLGRTEGEGWLIGPYLVTRLGDSELIFEARALSGRTQDRVSQTGQPSSTVSGDRSLLMAKLSGAYALNPQLTLSPSMSFAAVEQASAAYLAAGGTPIPKVSSTYREQTLGLSVQYVIANATGPLTLSGGLGWFGSDDAVNGAGQGLSYSLGVAQDFGEAANLNLDLTGQRDFENNIDRIGLSLQFQAEF